MLYRTLSNATYGWLFYWEIDMGRSVSTPRGTVYTSYAVLDDDFQEVMRQAFPSMSECDELVGREDRAVLENTFAYIGVSEYCGLVAMWICEKELDWRDEHMVGLRDRWLSQIQQKFRKAAQGCFGQALIKQGAFSNGKAIFAPMNGQQQGGLGLGYSSKEGWL